MGSGTHLISAGQACYKASLAATSAVTVEAEVEALIQRAMATYGRLDCAFNNAGMIALSPLVAETAAEEVARRGVRVNAICPAAIEGAMDKLFMDYFGMTKEQMAAAVPLGRMGTPEDVAAAVLFLCSNHAAFITGACLAVDGGYSAQ
jgi:NAD(P)-dependent dehydrogenase (short-subunit alcohol dehydrogenase family)